MGLVRAFTEALGQQPIIQALQLRDIPKLECAGAFDRRKELQLGRIFLYIYIHINMIFLVGPVAGGYGGSQGNYGGTYQWLVVEPSQFCDKVGSYKLLAHGSAHGLRWGSHPLKA